ncbi:MULTISPECIES: hypothetical protein [Enterobacteriaceae]
MGLFPSYPIFLWITWCKILFIVSDQNWKTFFHAVFLAHGIHKNSIQS